MNISLNVSGYSPLIRPLAQKVQAMPANDSATIVRGTPEQLRNAERALLSELASGDVDLAEIMAELTMIRRSLLAAGNRNVLRIA